VLQNAGEISQLEQVYSFSAWDNNVKCNISKIEAVQQNAVLFTFLDYWRASSTSAMLQKLNWESLWQRRACSRVKMLYFICNDLIIFPAADYLQPVPVCTAFETRYM